MSEKVNVRICERVFVYNKVIESDSGIKCVFVVMVVNIWVYFVFLILCFMVVVFVIVVMLGVYNIGIF